MRTIFGFLILISCINIGCQNKTIQNNGSNLDYSKLDKTKYSNNPGICEDTCYGDFNELGQIKSGKVLNIYISGYNVDLNKDCCQWTFAEIVNNNDPMDKSIEQINTYLVDKDFKMPKDSTQIYLESIKRTVMLVCENNMKGKIKYIVDPFDYGIYKKSDKWKLK